MQYQKFDYESFKYILADNKLTATFNFKIPPNISFNPKIVIYAEDLKARKLPKKVLDNLIFHLGLAEIASYWKATCSPQIEINCGFLTSGQINWWHKLIIKGLGEFFYQNKIDFTVKDFFQLKVNSKEKHQKDFSYLRPRYLVPLGGGRDSVVTIEALKKLDHEFSFLILNPTKAQKDIAKASGVKNQIIVERQIDQKLLDLNAKGFLNGHTPFSAYLSFLGVLTATLFNFRYLTPSNERSASEQNLNYLGHEINHQYSKTYEFERDFRSYAKEYLAPDIKYFSFLRPLYEIQISKIFAKYKKYHSLFRSCNRGRKTNTWCGECPKCLSVFISLFPFLKEEEIVKIFGANLYENTSLKPLLFQLIGITGTKPFECIGTYNEIKLGLTLSIKKYVDQKENLPSLLVDAEKRIEGPQNLLSEWDKNNFLPSEISKELKEALND